MPPPEPGNHELIYGHTERGFTLASMRSELAALYDMKVEEMDRHIPRITLADSLPLLDRPLMVVQHGARRTPVAGATAELLAHLVDARRTFNAVPPVS